MAFGLANEFDHEFQSRQAQRKSVGGSHSNAGHGHSAQRLPSDHGPAPNPNFRCPLCKGLAALLASASGAPAGEADADAAADQTAISKVISGTWGTPEAPVSINPVVTAGDHAVAGWTWGERGGRALLNRQKDAWTVVLCSGDALKEGDFLKQAGVPAAQADALAATLAEAEQKLPPERVKQFGTFEGTMHMHEETGGSHDAQHRRRRNTEGGATPPSIPR